MRLRRRFYHWFDKAGNSHGNLRTLSSFLHRQKKTSWRYGPRRKIQIPRQQEKRISEEKSESKEIKILTRNNFQMNKIIVEIRAGAGGDQKKSDRYFCQKKQILL